MSLARLARKNDSAGATRSMAPAKAANGLRSAETERPETDRSLDETAARFAPRFDWSLAAMSIDQPSIDQPSIDQPKMHQPRIDQPGIHQPGIDQPRIDQPKMHQPRIDRPHIHQPSIDQPKMHQPRIERPTIYQQRIDQLRIDHPSIDQPGIDQPKMHQPRIDQPGIHQPGIVGPTIHQPGIDRSTIHQPGMHQPSIDQQRIDQLRLDRPSIDQASIDQASIDQQRIDQRSIHQRGIDRPTIHQQRIDRPSTDTPRSHKADRGLITVGEAAANLRDAHDRRIADIHSHGPVRFRVPTTGDMKVLFDMGNVPEDVLKDRVQLALTRMAEEKKLKSADPVPELMKKIFPSPGLFDEAEYEKAVDVTDRTKIYQSVLDARAKVTAADKPKLKAVMADCVTLIGKCAADATNLKSVFGTKHAVAKSIYKLAAVVLTNAMNHMDSQIDTDYNLDDPQTGLGGWATFNNQHIHLKGSVAQVTNENEAKVTIIHESCHLANSSVGDEGGYYGLPGFEGAKEDVKITNAAHYEEIPKRILTDDKGETLSKYKDPATGNWLDFKPGASSSGAPLNFGQRVHGRSDDFLRKAWDKAGDVHGFIRDLRAEKLAGKTTGFKAHKARILEISRLMRLTVHEQPDATASINQIDVVLCEGVARATAKAYGIGQRATVPNPLELKMPTPEPFFKARRPSVMEQKLELKPMPELGPPLGAPVLVTEDAAAEKVIDDSIKAAGTVTGNFASDRKLWDWLVAEYQNTL